MKEKDVSIINKGCHLNGTLNFKGYLIIAGMIEGILNAENVVAEEGSIVDADVTSQNMTIAGTFKGKINVTDKLILLKTCNVRGSIKCGNLVVEEGGILNGDITPP